jgi:methionyl-tRNA formyltransferase
MQMDQGLDTGGILAQAKCPIRNTDTATDLNNRLAALGAELLKDNLEALLAGTLRPRSQDHGQATYASKISKKDARVDWTLAAGYLDRMVRAFNPWPVAYTGFASQRLRIWQAQPLESTASGAPGTVIKADHEGIDVVCGAGVLRLLEVQLPGGRRISASEFVNAHSLHGVRFNSV